MGNLVYYFRVVLHIFCIATMLYIVIMMFVIYYMRHFQRYPGQFVWLAKKISKLPYGTLFF